CGTAARGADHPLAAGRLGRRPSRGSYLEQRDQRALGPGTRHRVPRGGSLEAGAGAAVVGTRPVDRGHLAAPSFTRALRASPAQSPPTASGQTPSSGSSSGSSSSTSGSASGSSTPTTASSSPGASGSSSAPASATSSSQPTSSGDGSSGSPVQSVTSTAQNVV